MIGESKKKSEEKKGAAPWMLTYGDMMTLLLCFFVLLFAMSKIEEEQVKTVFESIRAFFDVKAAVVAGQITGKTTFQEVMQGISRVEVKGRFHGERAIIPHGFGEDVRVQFVDEGLKIEIGGRTLFEPGSPRIREEGREKLYKIALALEGQRLRIDVRGHTSRDPADLPSEIEDEEITPGEWNKAKWQLSWQRAYNVVHYLTHDVKRPGPTGKIGNHNLDWDRFRITACADSQPVVLNWHDRLDPEARLGIQRRVEIILSDEQVPYRIEGPSRRRTE